MSKIVTIKDTEQFLRSKGISEVDILNEENDILIEEVIDLRSKLMTARIACIILAVAFVATWLIVLFA